ncbi:MAG: hypothetical protein AABY27_02550 [Pseudomonadota bacterium]
MLKFKEEILRKLVHFSSLWIPFLYFYNSTAFMLRILISLSILALSLDISKKFIPSLNILIKKLMGSIMREEEKSSNSLSGATYLLVASTLTIAFFPKEIAIFSLSILVISDSMAAIIGKKYGRIHFMNKSLEGSLSFAASAYAIYYYFANYLEFNLPFKATLIAIFFGTIAEAFAKKIHLDDNLLIPLSISFSLLLGS